MTIKHIIGKILRHTFPSQMKLRDLKRHHDVLLQQVVEYNKFTKEEVVSIIKKQYENVFGRQLSLEHPQRFTEKIQWRKAYDCDPIYSLLSDKYAVREWVKKKIGEEYLIPIIGVWDSEKKIPWDTLPEQFVLKTNNGSATNTIVTDKNKINRKIVEENYRYWLNFPFGFNTMELHYNNIKPLVIAEQYMQPCDGSKDLKDYKFICYDGNPVYVWVDLDRYHNHQRKIYSIDWKEQFCIYGPYGFCEIDIPKPQNYDKMLEIVRILSRGFAHVRVDLYDINGRVYFGEMTFTSSSGLDEVSPDEWDYKLGELWDITKQQIDYKAVDV